MANWWLLCCCCWSGGFIFPFLPSSCCSALANWTVYIFVYFMYFSHFLVFHLLKPFFCLHLPHLKAVLIQSYLQNCFIVSVKNLSSCQYKKRVVFFVFFLPSTSDYILLDFLDFVEPVNKGTAPETLFGSSCIVLHCIKTQGWGWLPPSPDCRFM